MNFGRGRETRDQSGTHSSLGTNLYDFDALRELALWKMSLFMALFGRRSGDVKL
jgi:hypothetical protein